MSRIDSSLLDDWRAAVGRRQAQEQRLDVESLRRYALAVGADPDVERIHPPLGHWAFFLPAVEDVDLGPDGHPRRGGFLPAITLPRRMFAASAIQFSAPLELGGLARLDSTILDVSYKDGRSGELVFVEVDRTLRQHDRVCVQERQTYVYRHEGERTPVPAQQPDAAQGEIWSPEEVHLFRFSAATFNAHRIHYYGPYTKDVEGYPALVVQGPFTAARLAQLAARKGVLASFAFRAQAPLFLGSPIRLRYAEDGEVAAIRCDGAVAMTARAAYR